MSEARSGEQQELIERFQAEVSERFEAAGAATAEHTVSNTREAAEQAFYGVMISNESDTDFTVVIAYLTSGNSEAQLTEQIPLPSGAEPIGIALTRPGQCARLQAYAMLFYIDDQPAFISPPDFKEKGPWTPERISQEFPSDQEPCLDRWVVG